MLYANFFDNSAISLVNVDVVFFSNLFYPVHQSRGWYCKGIPHPAIPPSEGYSV